MKVKSNFGAYVVSKPVVVVVAVVVVVVVEILAVVCVSSRHEMRHLAPFAVFFLSDTKL